VYSMGTRKNIGFDSWLWVEWLIFSGFWVPRTQAHFFEFSSRGFIKWNKIEGSHRFFAFFNFLNLKKVLKKS